MMDLSKLGAFISQVGFPVFVAVYLLFQVVAISPKIDAMTKAVEDIRGAQREMLYLMQTRGAR